MPPSKSRIQFLDSLRAIAIVMVIGQHALGYSQLSPGVQSTIVYWFQVAVPIFFLVDGYLFAHRLEHTGKLDYRDYMQQSARRLVVPWLLFSLLYLMARLAYEYFGHPPDQIVLGRDLIYLLGAIWVGAPAVQLYFLLSLFFVRSLSFLTKYVQGLSPMVTLVAAFGLSVLWSHTNGMTVAGFQIKANWGGGQDPLLHAVWGLQYYLLGCALYASNPWLSRHAKVLAVTVLAILVVLYYGEYSSPSLTQYSYLCGFYLLLLAIGDRSRALGGIGCSTMGIYLVHQPVVLKGMSVASALVFDNTGLWCYLLVVIGTLVCSIWITRLLMKVPHAHRLFGEPRTVAAALPGGLERF
ncbi:MAG: acyltransferase [Nitrospira sp.]|nr:acyltransferase [Nitrospira sp.]